MNALPGAGVSLYKMPDSTFFRGVSSSVEGTFKFDNVPTGSTKLELLM